MEVRAVSDACPGVTVVGLDVHAHADTVPAGKRQSACQAEKVCTALRRDGRGAFHRFAFFVDGIGNIKIPLAQVSVGGLLDLIHRHRTGAGESRRPAGGTDGHGLRFAVAVTVICIAVVRIVCFHGERRGFKRISLLLVTFHVGFGGAAVNHDAYRRADGTAPHAEGTDAGGGGAVIQRGDSERAHIRPIDTAQLALRIGQVRFGGGGNFISYGREGACLFIRHSAGSGDGRNFRLAFRLDGEASLLRRRLLAFAGGHAADVIVLGVSLRGPVNQVRRDGSADGCAGAAAGERHSAGVGVQRPFVEGFHEHVFRRADLAVLHVRRGGVVDFIDRNLARSGDALTGAAAAGRHIEHALLVVRRHGERLVLVLAGDGEVRRVHVGFRGTGDGIPHEAPADGIPLLGAHVRRRSAGDGIDGAVIQRRNVQGLRRHFRLRISIAHVSLRRVGQAIDGKVRSHGEFVFLLCCFAHVVPQRIVLTGHFLYDAIHFFLQIAAFARIHHFLQLYHHAHEAIIVRLLLGISHAIAPRAGVVGIRRTGAVIDHGARQRSCSDVTVVFRAYSHLIGSIDDSVDVSLCFT